MAKRRRGMAPRAPRADVGHDHPVGTGGFLGQIGLFETANGMPHGVAAIAGAILVALVIHPISRVVRSLTRH